MDINVEIKQEIELEEPSVIKTEEEHEEIFQFDIKTESNLRTEETQTTSLYSTSVKKDSDNNIVYESDIKINKLKEEFSSSEEDEETLFQIKTEQLMLKSESEDDDSNTRAYWGEVRRNLTIINTHEMLLKNEILANHDESVIKEYNCHYFRNFRCSHCDFRTLQKGSLTKHVMIKHNEKISIEIYRCYHCDYKTHNKSNLSTHVLAKHKENAIKKYNCNLCNFKTHYKYNLNSHVLAKHDESTIKKYNCNICDYQTNNKNCLNRHVLAKHDDSGRKKYKCNLCDYKTNQKGHFNCHMLSKHDESSIKKYSCDYCDFRSHYERNLKKHIMMRHLKKISTDR